MLVVSVLKEAKMLLQVQDELLFECDEKIAEELKPILVYKMENVIKLKVPLLVNGGIGLNWDAAH